MNQKQAKEWIERTCGKGWLPLVDSVFENLPEGVEVTSIYQKWGALMFDASPWSDRVEEIHDRIECDSLKTCEICGLPGDEANINNWVHTRCVEHSNANT